MKIPSFRFLLPIFVTIALAGCGGATGHSSLPIGSIPMTPATGGAGTPVQSAAGRSSTQAVGTVPSGSYWSGTVSAINSNGITANCQYHNNFGQYYSCIPLTYASGVAISGTPVVGQYFQMWGDLSNLPYVTASTINYGSSPFPTTAPTSSSGTYMGFANGTDYSTSFTPYASWSIWRTKISSHPTIASYSANVVEDQFPNSATNAAIRATEAGRYDYNHPRFYATSTSPLVNVNCTTYCGDPDNGGVPSQIRIPPGARPARGSDAHFDVVQPDGTEITMYGTSLPSGDWTDGATVTAANVANCGSFSGSGGWLPSGPGPTAAGYCDDAGVVTAAELASGQINHAVLLTGECAVGTQYPVENYGSTERCSSGVGPPLGGREWYDVPCSTTQENGNLRPWEKAILCALNEYGGYLGDNQGGGWHFTGGIAPEFESEEPWLDVFGQNYTSPFAALASQGWSPITISDARSGGTGIRWVGADSWQPSGVDFPNHIHWLSPCSAQGTC